ncbi:MAG: hypothetical protein WD398_13970 [Cyclobacteriaceae bacterium]
MGHLTEETPINPKSKKGKVRAGIARMILDEVEAGKLNAMIVRAADFYGPRARLSFLRLLLPFRKNRKGLWTQSDQSRGWPKKLSLGKEP